MIIDQIIEDNMFYHRVDIGCEIAFVIASGLIETRSNPISGDEFSIEFEAGDMQRVIHSRYINIDSGG